MGEEVGCGGVGVRGGEWRVGVRVEVWRGGEWRVAERWGVEGVCVRGLAMGGETVVVTQRYIYVNGDISPSLYMQKTAV